MRERGWGEPIWTKGRTICYISQCCRSGSGIRCLFDPWIRDPGSRMGRKSASGSGIRDEQPGSYFPELRNHFFVFLGLKYLNSLMRIRDLGSRIRDGDSSYPGSRIRDGKKLDPGSGIRDKHPGSATLTLVIVYVISLRTELQKIDRGP